jgi:hypothetical protein
VGCATVSAVHVGEQDLHERQGRFHRGQRNFRGRKGDFPISGRTTRFQNQTAIFARPALRDVDAIRGQTCLG